jgi:hypothetical protein
MRPMARLPPRLCVKPARVAHPGICDTADPNEEELHVITDEKYRRYISDFNDCCAGGGMGFAAFFDKWYEPDATFEYVPMAAKNSGRDTAVAFWNSVSEIMQETIRDHTHFVASSTSVASEAPIDFVCKQDLEWVGVQHKKGSTFRLMMAAFYEVSPHDKFKYTRVYSIYHPDYQVG